MSEYRVNSEYFSSYLKIFPSILNTLNNIKILILILKQSVQNITQITGQSVQIFYLKCI